MLALTFAVLLGTACEEKLPAEDAANQPEESLDDRISKYTPSGLQLKKLPESKSAVVPQSIIKTEPSNIIEIVVDKGICSILGPEQPMKAPLQKKIVKDFAGRVNGYVLLEAGKRVSVGIESQMKPILERGERPLILLSFGASTPANELIAVITMCPSRKVADLGGFITQPHPDDAGAYRILPYSPSDELDMLEGLDVPPAHFSFKPEKFGNRFSFNETSAKMNEPEGPKAVKDFGTKMREDGKEPRVKIWFTEGTSWFAFQRVVDLFGVFKEAGISEVSLNTNGMRKAFEVKETIKEPEVKPRLPQRGLPIAPQRR